jgi:hypothetical protein
MCFLLLITSLNPSKSLVLITYWIAFGLVLPFIFPFMIVIGFVVTISITVLGTELEVPRKANTSCAILLLLIKDAVSLSVVNTALGSPDLGNGSVLPSS